MSAEEEAASLRISRLDSAPDPAEDEILEEVYAEIRRRGGPILNIHKVVGHSPQLLHAQATYTAALRGKSSIPRPLQQLAILRTAQLNDAAYELSIHVRATLGLGVSQQKVEAVESWQFADVFTDMERVVLGFAEEVAGNGIITDTTFRSVSQTFGPRGAVELAALVAWYVGNARFTKALEIRREAWDS